MSYSQLFFILFTVLNSIKTNYVGQMQQGGKRVAGLRHRFEFICEYTGDGNGEFADWFKQNATHDVSVTTDKPGHYLVKHQEKKSNLTVKIFVNADAAVTKWYVKTKKGDEPSGCQFGQVSIIPSPQGILDNKGEVLDSPHGSLRRSEDQFISLKCLIEPIDPDQTKSIKWEFSKDGKFSDDSNENKLPMPVDVEGDEVKIDEIKKSHRGYYRCTLNGISFTALLRVKDKLAALWPFIGIISTVVVLVIIILIFEKRQQLNKKSLTTDDDEQDQASDRLVQSSTRPSDNDNKKRAVKA